ncbi:MAG: hypothetical protein WCP57_12960 [Bacteroidota bacterium]
MKSIDFKRQSGSIRIRQEPKAKKPANWDRIIYIVVLMILGGLLLKYSASRWLYINADGQILFENINVRLNSESKIIKYYVHEDDSIKIGDTLFTFEIDHLQNENSYSSNTTILSNTKDLNYDDWVWFDKEIYNLKNKISQDQIIIQKNNPVIAELNGTIQRLSQEVLLGVLPNEQIESSKSQLRNLTAQNTQMQEEIRHSYALIADLTAKKAYQMRKPSSQDIQAQTNIASNGSGYTNDGIHEGLNYYLSPINGAVNHIYTNEFEMALKQDEIISLRSNKQIYIKAFIKQEDIKNIQIDDLVDIEFPNGEKQVGKVKRFYYATFVLPIEFQKKFEPTTRDVAVDIYPLDNQNVTAWQKFYKMSVKVTKSKYF